jgi:4-hydroxy-tetrahydrodipicolinate reductase
MKIIICGVNGRMGQTLAQVIAETEGFSVPAGVDKDPDAIKNSFPVFKSPFECPDGADVLIDFSRPEALPANLGYAQHKNIPLVIATTGYTEADRAEIKLSSEHIPIFMAANMSVGVSLQMELARRAAEFWGEDCDIEIVEQHHNRKVDAPSGTALALAECINNAMMSPKPLLCGRCSRSERRGREIGVHAVRGGTIPGDHTVMFISTDEILEIKHIAQSPRIFALGALRAAGFICSRPPGLYSMTDMIQQNAITNIYKDDGQAMITLANLPFSPQTISPCSRTSPQWASRWISSARPLRLAGASGCRSPSPAPTLSAALSSWRSIKKTASRSSPPMRYPSSRWKVRVWSASQA